MDLGAFARSKTGLTAFIACPLLILFGFTITAHVRLGRIEEDQARRTALLKTLASVEPALHAGEAAARPFIAAVTSAGDLTAELTQRASEVAQKSGFVVQSVTVDKPDASAGGCVAGGVLKVQGNGSVSQIERFMDAFESVPMRFSAGEMKLRARSLQPPVYDATIAIRTCEYTGNKSSPQPVKSDAEMRADMSQLAARLTKGSAAFQDKVAQYSTHRLEMPANPQPGGARTSDRNLTGFHLTGIIRHPVNPLALTDDGVKGIGDSVGGGKIVAIGDDSVTIADASGKRLVVRLYQE